MTVPPIVGHGLVIETDPPPKMIAFLRCVAWLRPEYGASSPQMMDGKNRELLKLYAHFDRQYSSCARSTTQASKLARYGLDLIA